MSYFLLPKNNNIIQISLKYDKTETKINTSLFNYYTESKEEIDELIKCNKIFDIFYDYESLKQLVHTYEYIYSNIPLFKTPISKLKTKTKLFYNLFELNNMFLIFNNDHQNILNIGGNSQDFNYYVDNLYKNDTNPNKNLHDFSVINNETYKIIQNNMYDIFFFEELIEDNSNNYINCIVKSLLIVFNNLSKNGTFIINIGNLFYSSIMEFLYLLSNLFENVYIMKPITSNSVTFEKYIVCKNLLIDNNRTETYKNNYKEILNYLNELYSCNNLDLDNVKNIYSIIDKQIPSYFINKIYDFNIIFGQNQLETMEQIKNILKSKNIDKLEILKKNNIQKCVLWCEKYNIPHNKFIESTNIFLSTNKDLEINI